MIDMFYFFTDGSEKLSDNSPGAASISSVDIANEFAGLSSEEQERVRAEWSQVWGRKSTSKNLNSHWLYSHLLNFVFAGIGTC